MSRTALITGASSGIGSDLAEVFASQGHNLVLTARRQDKLQALATQLAQKYQIKASVVVADLTDPQAPPKLFQQLQNTPIDILVNNAGYGIYGLFTDTDINEELAMIQLNITALTHLTKLFVPGMVARKYGKIMNVASTAAFQPGPLMAVYYATKAYVLSFSEALGNELQDQGVTVTALCPGPTKSEFQVRADMEKSKLVAGKSIMDSMTVAKIGYEGLMKGKPVVITGGLNKLFANGVRFMPRRAVTKIVRMIQEKAE